MPRTVSASSYQRLVDCPYQFYATDILGLSVEDSVSAMVEKSDYGQRIHLILAAFHSNVAALPGPFAQDVNEANRNAALAFLKQLSDAVFSRDIEDNIWHLGWLRFWEAHLAAYIDWQCQRQKQWHVVATESMRKRDDVIDGVALKGQLDRIDSNHSQVAIVDYKTGRTPRQLDVDTGEAVQLPFYAALINEPVSSATYLAFGSGKVQASPCLEGEELHMLSDLMRERLVVLLAQIKRKTPLPAWGDETTCSYCAMAGVCRRQSWTENNLPGAASEARSAAARDAQ
jgi:ATP-dependent helicase/nuclease subunit B